MAPGWILKEMGAFFTQEKKKKNKKQLPEKNMFWSRGK